jgi:hypothetical protein
MLLTDDDLTRELGEAFHAATTDLTYRGRTRPPRGIGPALPAAAASAVLVAVAIGAVNVADHPHPAVGHSAGRPSVGGPNVAGPPAAKARKLVTETMTLAGFTITFQHASGAPDPVVAELVVGGLPAGVRTVPLTGTEARVWVGTDPKSGDNALYVKAPTRNGGRLFALLSTTWSQHQLIDLVKEGTPRAVPLVSPGASGS